jgi:pimeloyl-ACP methyl ester carboxylesterase
MSATIQQKFIFIDGVNIHYRKTGSGPFMFLLHPSPRSSRMMEPLMQLLADTFTVIAPDTAGYGYSNALPERADSLYDYVPYLHKLIQSLTDEPVFLYGTATGAQLAIACSLLYNKQVQHLYLDNAAHFDDTECDEILKHYFPDFSPTATGSHLQKIWEHVCDSCLYFPWYDKKETNRIAAQLPPPSVIQNIVSDYVLAGTNYAAAYIAAFKHERAEKVQQLTCSTTIFKWLGSPVLKHMERLLQYELPKNVVVTETPVNMQQRFEKMLAHIQLTALKKL